MNSPLHNMCRLCACERPKLSVDMFSAIGKRHQLPDKIRLCLPITVDEDDKLPKVICGACLCKLDMCNELYLTSFTAQDILKSKLDNLAYGRSQFQEESSSTVNGVGCSSNEDYQAKPPTQGSSSKQITKKIQDSDSVERDKNNILEPQNSSVISQDVIVRLTSSENHSLSIPKVNDIYEIESPVDLESEIPRIIVTDITGAPLAPLKSDDESLFGCSPVGADVNDISSDVEMEEPDSSERLTDSKDKGGGEDVKRESPLNSSEETKASKKEKPNHRLRLKSKVKKTSSGPPNVKCQFCLKWFSKSIIEHHRRLHLKEKFYSCVDCGKNFSAETDLSSHSCGQS